MPDFNDTGFVLACRRHGESGIILSVFTQNHGRHLGLIRSKIIPQPGTFVHVKWHARLAEHLGNYTCETVNAFSIRYLEDAPRLAALSTLCQLLDESLPEREALPDFFNQLLAFLDQMDEKDWLAAYVRFEARLLSVLGFGMDLTKCAGGGDPNDLAYVSPKTARAVSREKGDPYREKLLSLPAFLYKDVPATPQDIQNGLLLTGYFLTTHVRKIPGMRQTLLKAVASE